MKVSLIKNHHASDQTLHNPHEKTVLRRILVLRWCFLILFVSLAVAGCIKPKITLFPDGSEPLKEYVLQGSEQGKILIVPITGFISDSQKDFSLRRKPGTVQEVVSQLRKAEKDKDIKAIILKIDSPGGTVTASDVLYHEIVQFKQRSRAGVVAIMMDVAASGGYYVALPAECIIAHPTTITGSVGVVFLRPNVSGLMDKLGLTVEADKSGRNKDMGSPFRKATVEEEQIVRRLTEDLGRRFLSLVIAHRRLSEEARNDVSTARIYLAEDALRLGLIDRIGYLDDAVRCAMQTAGLSGDPKVVVYRRTEYHDDNLYNTSISRSAEMPEVRLIDIGLSEAIPPLLNGFYYLWLPSQAR